MLTYNLDHSGKEPLYEQLYTSICEDIRKGIIHPGERLPSKRALAVHLNVSVTTVENAYHQLVEEGFLYARPSSGYYVNDYRPAQSAAEKPGRQQPETEDEYEIDFQGNICSLGLFPAATWTRLMRRVLSDVDNPRLLQAIPWNGMYELRSAISGYLRRYRGISAPPDRIVIGAGTEYLYLRLLQLLGPSAILAFEDPGYPKTAQIAAKGGITQQFIPVDEYGLNVDKLRRSRANVVHISPANHFPTGTVLSSERRRALLDWAGEDLYRFIIENDYDSEFSDREERNRTLYSMDELGRVVYINTFSKSLVPSLRISYMVLPKSLYQLYRQSQEFYSCTVSSFEQMTLALFISGGYFERHLNRLQNYYRKKKETFCSALLQSNLKDRIKVKKNTAGTHLLVRVRTAMTDPEIRERAHDMRIRLPLLSDYCHVASIREMNTLVINYAGMRDDDIGRAVSLLERLFLEETQS